jgi:hypothetical protein
MSLKWNELYIDASLTLDECDSEDFKFIDTPSITVVRNLCLWAWMYDWLTLKQE